MNSLCNKRPSLFDALINERRSAKAGGHGFILGCPGSGKTEIAQQQILSILKNTEDSVIVLDTDGTFSPWVEKANGQIINFVPEEPPHINLFDINMESYHDEEGPISLKGDFIIAGIESVMGVPNGLSPNHRSIIDMVTKKIYEPYLKHKKTDGTFDQGLLPTLRDFYRTMRCQSGFCAYEITEAISIFINGRINTFSYPTDIKHDKRLVVYNITQLGHTLGTASSLAALEHIWTNGVTGNLQYDKKIWVFIDDAYYLMLTEGSSYYLNCLYKRARAQGCILTAITQNLSYILDENSPIRNIFTNSDYIHLCRLPALEKDRCAQLLNLSTDQITHITNSPSGQSIIYTKDKIIEVTQEIETKTVYQHSPE